MSKFMSHLALTLLSIAILTTYFLPTTTHAQTCKPSGTLIGKKVPRSKCDPNDDPCCKAGQPYKTYKCSPPVTGQTKAILTQNNFSSGGDGGGPSECDNKYHSNNTPVVALSTGWYKRGSRCGQEIIIHGNGRTTRAKVVDECDSTMGCDDEHAYQQPCRHNVVDASDAVWKALGLASGVWIGSVFLNLLTQFGLLQRWKIDADRVMGKGKDLIAIQEPSQPKAQIDG